MNNIQQNQQEIRPDNYLLNTKLVLNSPLPWLIGIIGTAGRKSQPAGPLDELILDHGTAAVWEQ
jgi:hypothetical protein